MEKRTVLLIIDQRLGWDEVRRALAGIATVRLVGTAVDAAEAAYLAGQHRPDFIIATDCLDGDSTWPLLTALVQDASLHSKVIAYAHDCSPATFFPGIERWLIGYILRATVTSKQLTLALDLLLNGGMVLANASVGGAFAAALDDIAVPIATAPQTTPRQRTILRALADGATEKEVARLIGQSVGTVGREITTLKDNFDSATLPALLVAAMRSGTIR